MTFDGAAGTSFNFTENEDLVMGSQSWGNWSTAAGVGILAGVVTIVPRPAVSIPGASPGFIKAGATGLFADASAAAAGSLVLVARSSTRYAGFRVSFASGAKHPAYACEGGGSIPFSRGCYKSANFSLPVSDEFAKIKLPFAQFSDHWAPPTGTSKATCSQDPSTCVTPSVLSAIQRVEVWAEGSSGSISLELQSISAEA